MISLPEVFLGPPLAHRAYHDREAGRPENSRAAFAAAIAAGYGIECDVQLSADGRAMVFHDYDLSRLTPETGAFRERTVAELCRIPLCYSEEVIPALSDMLALTAGRVALLIEIKDQDGAMGPAVGELEEAVARDLKGYEGPVAVMSFNPHAVASFGKAAPGIARGLTTSSYGPEDWPTLPPQMRDRLREMRDYGDIGASFISHEAKDLCSPGVSALKAQGAAVLCWTIRSHAAEVEARRVAQNVTFEGYAASIPAA